MQMEASLTCAVCLSLFEDPVTLPVCSHNFCRHCVVEYLSQAASVTLPSSSASRPSSRSRDSLQQSPRAPGRPSRDGSSIILSCPLCRKLCSLPSDRGASALPVNTTLAEVVKLFRAASPTTKPSLEAIAEVDSSALVPQLAALGGICKKHPGRLLQLYCRMCRSGGCGQCVSEDHRGVFHSVNLIDTVYQEEKVRAYLWSGGKGRERPWKSDVGLPRETNIYVVVGVSIMLSRSVKKASLKAQPI